MVINKINHRIIRYMSKTKYKKLVRDNIPTQIINNGQTPVTRKLTKAEFRQELLNKLSEEVSEVAKATEKSEFIEELADVQEVLTAIYAAYNINCSDVTKEARKKRQKNGAFTKQQFLITVK